MKEKTIFAKKTDLEKIKEKLLDGIYKIIDFSNKIQYKEKEYLEIQKKIDFINNIIETKEENLLIDLGFYKEPYDQDADYSSKPGLASIYEKDDEDAKLIYSNYDTFCLLLARSEIYSINDKQGAVILHPDEIGITEPKDLKDSSAYARKWNTWLDFEDIKKDKGNKEYWFLKFAKNSKKETTEAVKIAQLHTIILKKAHLKAPADSTKYFARKDGRWEGANKNITNPKEATKTNSGLVKFSEPGKSDAKAIVSPQFILNRIKKINDKDVPDNKAYVAKDGKWVEKINIDYKQTTNLKRFFTLALTPKSLSEKGNLLTRPSKSNQRLIQKSIAGITFYPLKDAMIKNNSFFSFSKDYTPARQVIESKLADMKTLKAEVIEHDLILKKQFKENHKYYKKKDDASGKHIFQDMEDKLLLQEATENDLGRVDTIKGTTVGNLVQFAKNMKNYIPVFNDKKRAAIEKKEEFLYLGNYKTTDSDFTENYRDISSSGKFEAYLSQSSKLTLKTLYGKNIGYIENATPITTLDLNKDKVIFGSEIEDAGNYFVISTRNTVSLYNLHIKEGTIEKLLEINEDASSGIDMGTSFSFSSFVSKKQDLVIGTNNNYIYVIHYKGASEYAIQKIERADTGLKFGFHVKFIDGRRQFVVSETVNRKLYVYTYQAKDKEYKLTQTKYDKASGKDTYMNIAVSRCGGYLVAGGNKATHVNIFKTVKGNKPLKVFEQVEIGETGNDKKVIWERRETKFHVHDLKTDTIKTFITTKNPDTRSEKYFHVDLKKPMEIKSLENTATKNEMFRVFIDRHNYKINMPQKTVKYNREIEIQLDDVKEDDGKGNFKPVYFLYNLSVTNNAVVTLQYVKKNGLEFITRVFGWVFDSTKKLPVFKKIFDSVKKLNTDDLLMFFKTSADGTRIAIQSVDSNNKSKLSIFNLSDNVNSYSQFPMNDIGSDPLMFKSALSSDLKHLYYINDEALFYANTVKGTSKKIFGGKFFYVSTTDTADYALFTSKNSLYLYDFRETLPKVVLTKPNATADTSFSNLNISDHGFICVTDNENGAFVIKNKPSAIENIIEIVGKLKDPKYFYNTYFIPVTIDKNDTDILKAKKKLENISVKKDLEYLTDSVYSTIYKGSSLYQVMKNGHFEYKAIADITFTDERTYRAQLDRGKYYYQNLENIGTRAIYESTGKDTTNKNKESHMHHLQYNIEKANTENKVNIQYKDGRTKIDRTIPDFNNLDATGRFEIRKDLGAFLESPPKMDAPSCIGITIENKEKESRYYKYLQFIQWNTDVNAGLARNLSGNEERTTRQYNKGLPKKWNYQVQVDLLVLNKSDSSLLNGFIFNDLELARLRTWTSLYKFKTCCFIYPSYYEQTYVGLYLDKNPNHDVHLIGINTLNGDMKYTIDNRSNNRKGQKHISRISELFTENAFFTLLENGRKEKIQTTKEDSVNHRLNQIYESKRGFYFTYEEEGVIKQLFFGSSNDAQNDISMKIREKTNIEFGQWINLKDTYIRPKKFGRVTDGKTYKKEYPFFHTKELKIESSQLKNNKPPEDVYEKENKATFLSGVGNSLFGCAVSLNEDSLYICDRRRSLIYTYVKYNKKWSLQGRRGTAEQNKKVAPVDKIYCNFGKRIASSENHIIVSEVPKIKTHRGQVYLYEKQKNKSNNSLSISLYPSKQMTGKKSFGESLAIGEREALVGEPEESKAYLYSARHGWALDQVFTSENYYFGFLVALAETYKVIADYKKVNIVFKERIDFSKTGYFETKLTKVDGFPDSANGYTGYNVSGGDTQLFMIGNTVHLKNNNANLFYYEQDNGRTTTKIGLKIPISGNPTKVLENSIIKDKDGDILKVTQIAFSEDGYTAVLAYQYSSSTYIMKYDKKEKKWKKQKIFDGKKQTDFIDTGNTYGLDFTISPDAKVVYVKIYHGSEAVYKYNETEKRWKLVHMYEDPLGRLRKASASGVTDDGVWIIGERVQSTCFLSIIPADPNQKGLLIPKEKSLGSGTGYRLPVALTSTKDNYIIYVVRWQSEAAKGEGLNKYKAQIYRYNRTTNTWSDKPEIIKSKNSVDFYTGCVISKDGNTILLFFKSILKVVAYECKLIDSHDSNGRPIKRGTWTQKGHSIAISSSSDTTNRMSISSDGDRIIIAESSQISTAYEYNKKWKRWDIIETFTYTESKDNKGVALSGNGKIFYLGLDAEKSYPIYELKTPTRNSRYYLDVKRKKHYYKAEGLPEVEIKDDKAGDISFDNIIDNLDSLNTPLETTLSPDNITKANLLHLSSIDKLYASNKSKKNVFLNLGNIQYQFTGDAESNIYSRKKTNGVYGAWVSQAGTGKEVVPFDIHKPKETKIIDEEINSLSTHKSNLLVVSKKKREAYYFNLKKQKHPVKVDFQENLSSYKSLSNVGMSKGIAYLDSNDNLIGYYGNGQQGFIRSKAGLFEYTSFLSEPLELAFLDQYGQDWAFSKNYIYKLGKDGKPIEEINNPYGVTDGAYAVDVKKRIWITTGSVLGIFDAINGRIDIQAKIKTEKKAGSTTSFIIIDSEMNFYVGSSLGLSRYDTTTREVKQINTNKYSNGILYKKNKAWLMESRSYGSLNTKTNTITQIKGRTFFLATNFFRDKLNRLWLSLFRGGLGIIDDDGKITIKYNVKLGFTGNWAVVSKNKEYVFVGSRKGLKEVSLVTGIVQTGVYDETKLIPNKTIPVHAFFGSSCSVGEKHITIGSRETDRLNVYDFNGNVLQTIKKYGRYGSCSSQCNDYVLVGSEEGNFAELQKLEAIPDDD